MIKRISAVFLVVLSLSGCFSLTPTARFYALETPTDQQPLSDRPFHLAISDIRLPDLIDRPQMARLTTSNSDSVKFAEFDRWNTDFDTAFQTAFMADLQTFLPKADINILSYGSSPDYIIDVSVNRLIGAFDSSTVLEAEYAVLNAQGNKITAHTVRFETLTGTTYASYAKAQSDLIARLAKAVAQTLIKLNSQSR